MRARPTAKGEIPVELWAAIPPLDLALIKLGKPGSTFPPLPVATGVPAVGDEVWAFGFPAFRFRVSYGAVTGIRSRADLDRELGRGG